MATSPMEKVTNNSGSNSNGYYCKMPDGTLIQWGLFECNDTKTSEYYNLNLPHVFEDISSGHWSLACTNYGADTGQEHLSVWSMNSNKRTLTVKVVKPSGWAAFQWIAIGRWK